MTSYRSCHQIASATVIRHRIRCLLREQGNMYKENITTVPSSTDRLQKQRFELKYVIDESKAQAIRFFCQNYLMLDRYGSTQPDNSYTVNSIYLDSPAYKTYHDTINGNRNRYKLRLRYYDQSESQPVFLEIKRRYNFIIAKKRATVKRTSVDPIVAGHFPTMNDLVQPDSAQLESLTEFYTLVNYIQAGPTLHIAYLREAWERQDSNSVRVTFDRDVKAKKVNRQRIEYDNQPTVSVFGNQVILEIKFTDRFPHWLRELVQRFSLRQESAAKYVDGIIRMKERKLDTF